MCKFCKQRAANAFVNLDLFHSYHDYFLQNYTIKRMKCQHNPYLESIKKHNRQKIRKIPKSIIGKFWSIIDSSLTRSHCLLFHKISTDWDSPLGYKQVISHYTCRILLLLTLVLGFASDSCNNNDILLVVGYNYNLIIH